MSDSNRWEVVSIREYTDRTGVQRTNWTKIGTGFTNKNGSINVILDAFPIDGKLQLQVPMTQAEKDAKFSGQGRAMRQQNQQNYQQGNPRNTGQQQRSSNAQRYGSRGASRPQQGGFVPEEPYTPDDGASEGGYDEGGGPPGWDINGTWVTDARQLPKDHPDYVPF